MDISDEHASFPPDLPLRKASFYALGGSVYNINTGTLSGYEYVAFDYSSQSGDFSHTETIVAIKTSSPQIPNTNLSRTSGLRLERIGAWIFAFETRRIIIRSEIGNVVEDIINLLEYAKAFPQNI
jgi:hypothetical protein